MRNEIHTEYNVLNVHECRWMSEDYIVPHNSSREEEKNDLGGNIRPCLHL